MCSGETSSSNSRATLSVNTRVLPDPALADTQVDTPGSAACTWRSLAASRFMVLPPVPWQLLSHPIRQIVPADHNHLVFYRSAWRGGPYNLGWDLDRL